VPAFLDLRFDGLHHGWMGMAQYHREVSAPIVSVLVPVYVCEFRAVRFLNEEWVWFKVPVLVRDTCRFDSLRAVE
jgi:hypothetical protein